MELRSVIKDKPPGPLALSPRRISTSSTNMAVVEFYSAGKPGVKKNEFDSTKRKDSFADGECP